MYPPKWRKKIKLRWEDLEKEFGFDIPEDEPIVPLNIACELLHMQYYLLHEVIKEGIIKFRKEKKKKKLLSFRDMKRLKYVKYLIDEKGVNVKGIKLIFEIKEEE